ncbi:MAG: hypothetical protein WD042_02080 [Phycisphaeraceae bacterium]
MNRMRRYFDEAVEWVEHHDGGLRRAQDVARRATHNVEHVVREHPVPTLLAGAGLGLLVYAALHQAQMRKRRGYEQAHGGNGPEGQGADSPGSDTESKEARIVRAKQAWRKARATASGAAAAAGEWASEAGEAMAHAAGEMGHTAAALGRRAKAGAVATRDTTIQTVEQYPLASATAALGLGVLVGLTLRRTRQEDRALGELGQAARQRLEAKGHELLEHGQNLGRKVIDAAAEVIASDLKR